MGLGFTFALAILGSIRELIGSGTWAGMQVMPKSYVPISIFVLQPGAFFALGCMIAVMTAIMSRKKKTKTAEQDCNPADCAGCASSAHCGKRIFEETAKAGLKEDGGDKA